MLIPNKKFGEQDLKEAKIANVVGANGYVLSIGDCIQPGPTGHTTAVTGAASSGLILGVIVGIKKNGKVMEMSSVTGVNTTTALSSPSNVGNDNETLGEWSVSYIPAYIPMEYKADLSAASTTTDSNGVAFFPLLGVSSTAGTAGKLNEASPALFGGSAAQFVSFGLTPESTSKVVGHIYQNL